MTTLGQLLAEARSCGLDRLDAQLLLARATGHTRESLIAHDQDSAQDSQATAFRAAVAQRASGTPLAYITGQREFHGLLLQVTPDVLVPRPETELLVEWALELLAAELGDAPCPDVVDLGTGSGAIALAVKHGCPRASLLAVDVSTAALRAASANARAHRLDITFEAGDWLANMGSRHFDLILANPPYIDASDPHMAALHAEPAAALTPGPDGLAALRLIVAQAPQHMRPDAWLLLEHGHDQACAVRALFAQGGFKQITTRHDLASVTRCTGGQLAPR